jgi:glycosyltransferase involved in cell wall biosynthesis
MAVRAGERVRVLPGSAVHVGHGYKIDVEAALDRVHEILDDPEEWRAKTKEHAEKVLAGRFAWPAVADQILAILERRA